MTISELYSIFLSNPIISTDTRDIKSRSMFFALKGARFDGNAFAMAALEAGAAFAVVDDPALEGADERIVVVDDVLTTLQSLARYHREQLNIPILAIAGSNGKTTTKELTWRVLATKYRVTVTQGNLNNHIGVPLTLLSMSAQTEFGVVEMGASSCGEIALLCSIAKPNYGILTNVGRAHLEGFGGVEGVRRGKGELYDYLAANGGECFIAKEDVTLAQMAEERDGMKANVYSVALADGVENHLEGEYNRKNIAAAMAIGRRLGVGEESARQAIADYFPKNNRSQKVVSGTNSLVVDCYNANPSSMQVAIKNLLEDDFQGAKVAILGDMMELGDWSLEEHRGVVAQFEGSAVELYLVGENFTKVVATPQSHIHLYPSREELAVALGEQPITDSLILIKGSRSIGLEKIVELC